MDQPLGNLAARQPGLLTIFLRETFRSTHSLVIFEQLPLADHDAQRYKEWWAFFSSKICRLVSTTDDAIMVRWKDRCACASQAFLTLFSQFSPHDDAQGKTENENYLACLEPLAFPSSKTSQGTITLLVTKGSFFVVHVIIFFTNADFFRKFLFPSQTSWIKKIVGLCTWAC